MSDPESVLVAGDEQERRIRELYGAWLRHGLDVVERIADRTDGGGWPDAGAPPDLPRTSWAPRASGDPDAVRDALAHGWLVTEAATDDPSAEPSRDGALGGLTVAVKDLIDVAGLPTRNGTAGALETLPTRSAPAWSLLAEAGARCVGKAATHEMAWGVTTPQIANPFAPDRVAGGSSGGSAACVAAGVAQGALGTDTGGSIRIPAALCGVVGFRPTTGTVPVTGITPLAPAQDTPGPIAADVSTCTAMLESLLDRGLASQREDARGLRVGVLADPGRLQPEVRRAYERVLGMLERAGADVVTCATRLHRDAGSVSLVTMLLESAKLHAASVRAAPASFGGPARALLTLGERLDPYNALVRSARTQLAAGTAALFADAHLDALLTPTVPCVAPVRDSETVRVDGRDEPVAAALTRFTAWASVTAMPALTVPVTAPGLPVGVQVLARPGHEHVCVRLAQEIEALDSDSDVGCDE